MRAKLILFVAFLSVTAGGPELRAQGYTVTDLGTLGSWTNVSAINESGQAAGDSLAPAGWRAYRYSAGIMLNLGTIGGSAARMFGKGINASGHVVGEYDLGLGTTSRAFLYDGTALVDIGTLGGTYASAAAINAAGVIVGSSTLAGDLMIRCSSVKHRQWL